MQSTQIVPQGAQEMEDLLMRLADSTALQLPISRFNAYRVAFFQAMDTARRATSEAIMPSKIPKDDEGDDDWDAIYAVVNQHVGLSVARSKALGTAASILKQIGEVYRNEVLPMLNKHDPAHKIKTENDRTIIEAEIVKMEEAVKATEYQF